MPQHAAFLTARVRGGRALAALAGAIALTCSLLPGVANAGSEAQAASKQPLTVSVLVSSRQDVCHDPGDVGAIRKLVGEAREQINLRGGIAGHPVEVEFLDDKRDKALTASNIKSVLKNESALALVGLSNSNNAKHVFETIGNDIKAAAIPFVSDLSINALFAEYPTVFTTRASQDDERLPVMLEFLKQSKAERIAFFGLADQVFSASLGDGLKAALGEKLVADRRFALAEDKLNPDHVKLAAEEIKQLNPDMLVVSVGSSRTAEVMKLLTEASAAPPLFLTGRIDSLPPEVAKSWPNHIYQLAWDRLPDIYNDRMLRRVTASPPADWVFEGAKIAAAPGWAKGECKERDGDADPEPLSSANMRAIALGTQYADMLGLIAAAASSAPPNSSVKERRAHVVDQLRTTYAAGRGIYQGAFENWSFRPSSRAASRNPFIVRQPRGLGRTQLASLQFVRLKNDNLRVVRTLYLDIDMIRIFRVDDNEKSFFAEFHLSMNDGGKGVAIDQIEFANAFLDPRTNDRRVTVRTLSTGESNAAYPDGISIYHVAGQFMFEPTLGDYPFDTQRFTIDIRPKQGDAPFIVQPPPMEMRDRAVLTDGWDARAQFVGYDEDFVQTLDARTHESSVIPFYKASFSWLMNRETTDYYLRVVVPLGFILIVAYLSIFIPLSHFEAIVTIQVTALLSAVALYLSLPKLDADTTTLSDRLFLFNYLAVSLMIGISILRMNGVVAEHKMLRRVLGWAHVALIPLLVLAMAYYVHKASLVAM